MPVRLDELIQQQRQTKAQTSITPMRVDDLLKQKGMMPSPETDFGTLREPTETIAKRAKGGLNVFQRSKMSFGNYYGRKQYLENSGFKDVRVTSQGNFIMKHPDTNQWLTTDPRGFDLGDWADLPGGMLILPFWTLGAAAGGTVTSPTVAGIPAGIVGGGMVGGAMGEIFRQNVGQLLGIYKGTAGEKAMGAMIEGLWSGLAEAGAFKVKQVLKPMAKVWWKKRIQPGIENIAQFFAGKGENEVMQDAINHAIKHSPLKVLNRKNWSKEIPHQLAQIVHDGMTVTHNTLQRLWSKYVKPITRKITNTINYDSVRKNIRTLFQEFRLLDTKGHEIPTLLGKTPRRDALMKMYYKLMGKTKKNMPVGQAMALREEIDGLINKGFKDNIFSTKDMTMLKQIRRFINNEIHTKFRNIARLDKYYSRMHDAFDMLNIDWGNPGQVARIENLFAKFPGQTVAINEAVKAVDKFLPKQYKFLDKLITSNFAKELQSKTLRGIRTGIIRSLFIPFLAVSGYAVGGPALAAVGGAAGVTLSMPRGWSMLLRTGARGMKAVRPAAQAGLRIGVKAAAKSLRELKDLIPLSIESKE